MSKTNSVLNNKADLHLDLIKNGKEGVDFINISKYSETELGKRLAPGYSVPLYTIFGKSYSVRATMDYATIKNYPKALLGKKELSIKDIKKIPNKPINIPNYGSVLAYILGTRILEDKEVIEMIKELDDKIEFVSFISKRRKLFGKTVIVNEPNTAMGKYLSVVRHIRELIKNDNFNEETLEQLVIDAKDDPEKDIFSGTPVKIEEQA